MIMPVVSRSLLGWRRYVGDRHRLVCLDLRLLSAGKEGLHKVRRTNLTTSLGPMASRREKRTRLKLADTGFGPRDKARIRDVSFGVSFNSFAGHQLASLASVTISAPPVTETERFGVPLVKGAIILGQKCVTLSSPFWRRFHLAGCGTRAGVHTKAAMSDV